MTSGVPMLSSDERFGGSRVGGLGDAGTTTPIVIAGGAAAGCCWTGASACAACASTCACSWATRALLRCWTCADARRAGLGGGGGGGGTVAALAPAATGNGCCVSLGTGAGCVLAPALPAPAERTVERVGDTAENAERLAPAGASGARAAPRIEATDSVLADAPPSDDDAALPRPLALPALLPRRLTAYRKAQRCVSTNVRARTRPRTLDWR
jgi:hypothetical protein